MSNTEQSIRELAARIQVPDDECSHSVRSRIPDELGQLRSLAAAIAGAQHLANPSTALKGLALFASDTPGKSEAAGRIRELLAKDGALQTMARMFDVKLATVDVGLTEEFSGTELATQILRQRLRVIGLAPEAAAWESVQAGIRVACLMKGKDTDIFGLSIVREAEAAAAVTHLADIGSTGEWAIGAATGFLLAAADLHTPVVVSGPEVAIAARLACELAPGVSGYLIPAQAGYLPDGSVAPVFRSTMPHELATVISLSICDGAARLTRCY